MGRAAVHEVAARLGMDPREVASRLVALSATGLPLLVGVECDPARLRAALAPAPPAYGYPPQQPHQAMPSGPMHVYAQPVPPQPPSGPYSVPSGPYSVPSGPQQVPAAYQRTGPPSAPFPAQTGPPSAPVPLPPAEGPISTWGPPQMSTWARGDQPPQDMTQQTVRTERPGAGVRQGKVGSMLQTEGLEGEQLSIQLVEVVDPADYLFTAAGYRLQEGERSVVVHTELTNRGTIAFQSLPDMYLVLVTPDGKTITKAPVSLSSRPPHRIGVPPGETAGGHTVYVVPENIEVTQVRWSPRPDEESRTLTWNVEDN
ncbi:AsnC family protein [Actinophytocola xinjiangensis]|uniref:AsnC family protein n=1 Tax=Actinophytocola xinjiangensis TaxID=485602 RepID=A0A7Z0WEJ7_9PSEU|nr:AsnC family protein [Actinophytocola xinjiangensis]OLF05497.1 AsnC family protein [Actinophytocola xinjiangensis]